MEYIPKPCPLCRGENLEMDIESSQRVRYRRASLYCEDCGIQMDQVIGASEKETLEDIVQRWNKRPEEQNGD